MKRGTCIHYTGLTNNESCCKAGVHYRDQFDGWRPGIFLRLPCVNLVPGRGGVLQPLDRRDQVKIPCPLYQEPTDAQIAAYDAETEAFMAKAMTAIKVAGKWRVKPKPETDRREVIECPICQGRLHLYQSAYNGHCHGQCETEGCVKWME